MIICDINPLRKIRKIVAREQNTPIVPEKQKTKFNSRKFVVIIIVSVLVSGQYFTSKINKTEATTIFVKSASGSKFDATSVSAIFGSNVAANNIIAVFVYWLSTINTLTSITDNCGGIYTIVGNPTTGSSGRVAMAYSVVGSTGSCTVTANFSGSQFAKIIAHEIYGVNTSSPLDNNQHVLNYQAAPGTGTNAITSGSITTTQNGDYIFGATVAEDCSEGGTLSAGTGYASRALDSSGSCSMSTEDIIQTSAGSIAATFQTTTGWANYITGIMAFKDAPSPSGTAPSISSFISNPSAITSGQSSTLSWSVSGNPPSTISISGVGVVLGSSITVSPTQTTTYILTATNSQGSATANTSVTVTASPAPDTSHPSVPVNLSATSISASQINLSWSASSDNIGVIGYRVYRNDFQIGTSTTNSYSDIGLSASTQYSYTIVAYDVAGNLSSRSLLASATTQATGSVDIIPADRLVTWQGNVGVEGGIPTRMTQIDCTAVPYNVHADGVDTSGNIQACLNGIASGQVAYLPAGMYTLASTISIPSNKTLRGAGKDNTILNFTNLSLTNDVIIYGG